MPRVLALTANPIALDPLRLDAEIRQIRLRLAGAPNFRFEHHGATRAEDLLRLLETIQPDILHFSGHGSKPRRGASAIALENANGHVATVGDETLKRLFRGLTRPPQCVFLNSCYSTAQARAIGRRVSVVMGAKDEIDDDVAMQFSSAFYEWLGLGKSVQRAFEFAKTQVTLEGGDARLFVLQDKAQAAMQLRFFGRPELLAEFKTNPRGIPIRRKSGNQEYEIDLWIRGAEEYAESVVYEACDDTYSDSERFWEVTRTEDSQFRTSEFTSYGQLTLRAQIWSRDGGIGIASTLTDALGRRYGRKLRPPIRKAITELMKY